MSQMRDEELYELLREAYDAQDPVPDGMVARLQANAALAAYGWDEDLGIGLDMELMTLVERSEELAGARGGSGYTLRFAHEGVDLLVRVSGDGSTARIDGWVVPPTPVTVTLLREGQSYGPFEVGTAGRFELPGLASGLLRLSLAPVDGSTPFVTPAFEI